MTIKSTRSNANEDARRDFDDFDVDEELRRFRSALRQGQWGAVAELAANLDEYLSRGGSLPVAWLGPTCMQDQDDHEERLRASMEAAAKMSAQDRQDAIWRPSPNANSYRWDEIGGYVVSTIRFSDSIAEANGARYETLVYSIADGEWGNDGVQSVTEDEAAAAHVAACDRLRGRIQ